MHEVSPVGALELLASQTGAEFPHLLDARQYTETELGKYEAQISKLPRDQDVCVVLFGSWGRMELTPHSDDDWLILVDGATRGSIHPTDKEAETVLGVSKRKPGKQKVFGTHAFCDVLEGHIGLEEDDNANLTRRVLLMLESVPIAGRDVHRRCWERVLDGYLAESRQGKRPPRFFLNDVVRYWRTICVDFVGKQRDDGEKWGTRNAKLRTSRKVLFAGGLLPLLQCRQFDVKGTRAFLVEQLLAPPTDRLAYAFLRWDAAESGARCLEAYDRWIGMLKREDVRTTLDNLDREKADDSAVFRDVRRIARELDRGLLTLLFETGLEPVSRQYGIF
jgi:hypothetical protein